MCAPLKNGMMSMQLFTIFLYAPGLSDKSV